MKKAGIRFSNDLMLSFEYNEETKNVNIIVIDGNDRLTGDITVTNAAKTTRKTTK